MANTYEQRGDFIDHTAPSGGVSSGDVVVFNSGADGRIGVAVDDADEGQDVAVHLEGVHKLAKVSGTAFSQGDPLYWDSANDELTATASGATPAGYAFAAADSADTTAKVKLPG